MALIKSKQLKDVAAAKVVETTDKRFVSDAEKAVFNDKYTKIEVDTKTTAIDKKIVDTTTDLDNKLTAKAADLKTNIDGVESNLKIQIGNINTALSDQITTAQDNLAKQINNAIAGLTWKSPVPSFADIATVYPKPVEGWMVTVSDSNKVYRYDEATKSWVEFPLQVPQTYSKTILLPVLVDGTTEIKTGIRNDNSGSFKTGHAEIQLAVNGFIQAPGDDKDYTSAFVNNELVITWKARHFQLETDDELEVTYTHFDII